MKVLLMYRDRDVDLEHELPRNEAALTQDLALETLFGAMALGDPFIFEVARKSVLASMHDPDAMTYRQHVLADAIEHPTVARELYTIAIEAMQAEKSVRVGWMRDSPDAIATRAVQVLELFVGFLKRLRQLADEHVATFRSDGFVRFFTMLREELDDEYLGVVEAHLKDLHFHRGILVSAELGSGNRSVHHVLRQLREPSWRERLSLRGRPGYAFQIDDRDQSGWKALADLRGKGLNRIANALGQSSDHILGFFEMLRAELAFYVGCINLHDQLTTKGEPTCFPVPESAAQQALSARQLYDACLSLNIEARVVGNDLEADAKSLVMITGANQGGKSTFLRSVGLAQLMMQCGMFVPAQSFRANVCNGIFTHYKREEDASMQSGKLDEELARMSDIADDVTPSSMVLFNESFAATNEREGSQIARQVVRALTSEGIKVVFVTHLYDLAHALYAQELDGALFLRAERAPDGQRSYRLPQGEPLPTSYGEDSYRRIFRTSRDAAPATLSDSKR
jgi:hypothetical protein